MAKGERNSSFKDWSKESLFNSETAKKHKGRVGSIFFRKSIKISFRCSDKLDHQESILPKNIIEGTYEFELV